MGTTVECSQPVHHCIRGCSCACALHAAPFLMQRAPNVSYYNGFACTKRQLLVMLARWHESVVLQQLLMCPCCSGGCYAACTCVRSAVAGVAGGLCAAWVTHWPYGSTNPMLGDHAHQPNRACVRTAGLLCEKGRCRRQSSSGAAAWQGALFCSEASITNARITTHLLGLLVRPLARCCRCILVVIMLDGGGMR